MSKANKDSISVHGFFRMQIKEKGENGKTKVVGDSGWCKNTVTELGFQHYIVESIGSIAGSSQAAYLALGTGTAPAASGTSLPSELTDAAGCRMAITPSAVSSKTLRMVGSLNSNIITAARTIQNIGIFAVSTTAAGSILAGNTYATSSLATNQTVSATYELRFT